MTTSTNSKSRRAFLFKVSVLLNGAVGAVLAVPILGYILGAAFKKRSSYNSWVALGSVSEFPEGETRLVDYRNPITVAWDGQTGNVACWVRPAYPANSFKCSPSTARISVAPSAGSHNRNCSCAHAMAEHITRMDLAHRDHPHEVCSNTNIRSPGIN